jgi:hypothetical protein
MSTIDVAKNLVGYQSPMQRLAGGLVGCMNCQHSKLGGTYGNSVTCTANGFYVNQLGLCKQHLPKPTGEKQ